MFSLYRVTKPLRYIRILIASDGDLVSSVITDEATLHEAKLLHATTYIRKGYVTPHVLDEQGILSREEDPYQDHSIYFAVTSISSGRVLASSRLVLAPPGTSLANFQTLVHMKLFKDSSAYLEQHAAKTAVEVSALVKDPGVSSRAVFMLYRAMWQYSVTNNHKLWLFTCNAQLYKRLEYIFGGAMKRLGPTQRFHGHDFEPAALDIAGSIEAFAKGAKSLSPSRRIITRRVAKFFINGLPEQLKDPHIKLLRKLAD